LCEDWRWGSAWRRIYGTAQQKKLLDAIPADLPDDYVKWINIAEKDDDINMIRTSVNKGMPYGEGTWVGEMISKHHLESTMKSPGRPKKNK